MGIDGLKSLIGKCGASRNIKHYRYKKGALDTSIFLYRYIYRSPTEDECERYVIDGFLQQLQKFKKYNIIPIYIIDGTATQTKKVLEKRQTQRNKTNQKISTFQDEIQQFQQELLIMEEHTTVTTITSTDDTTIENEDNQIPDVLPTTITTPTPTPTPTPTVDYEVFEIQKREIHTKIEERRESVYKLEKQTRKPTRNQTEQVKKLFDILNVPYIQSPIESDALFAYLMKQDKIDFVFTEDTDMLPLGCKSFVCGFENPRIEMTEFKLDTVLQELELDYKQFVDLCILCGCDYTTGKIDQIGPKRGLTLIKKYKNIEAILVYINSTEKLQKKHPYPEDFLEQVSEAREMFYNCHNFEEHLENSEQFINDVEKFNWSGNIKKDNSNRFRKLLQESGMDIMGQNKWIKIFGGTTTLTPTPLHDKSQKSIFSFFKSTKSNTNTNINDTNTTTDQTTEPVTGNIRDTNTTTTTTTTTSNDTTANDTNDVTTPENVTDKKD